MVQETPAPRETITVLLVEDSAGDAELITLELEEAEQVTFQVQHVSRLAEALEVLERGDAQAVLLDLGLPDSQGMATFERARATAHHMPIIVLTGLEDEQLGVRAVQAGAQDYLVKGQVRELARFLGIPQAIIDKPPSAGLWQGQTDEGELGLSYDELDRYLLTGACSGEARARIEAMIAASAHKRVMPPVPGF